jgi:hypothetical protein
MNTTFFIKGGKPMKRSSRWLTAVALICAGFASLMHATPAAAFNRANADLFAVLPAGATGPEGLAVAPNGDVYVATFGFNTAGEVPGPGKIYVFNDNGKLLRTLSVQGTTSHLLGIAFHPRTHALLVIDFGAASIRPRVNPPSS